MKNNKNKKLSKSKLSLTSYTIVALLLPMTLSMPLGFNSDEVKPTLQDVIETKSITSFSDTLIEPTEPIPADYFDFSRSNSIMFKDSAEPMAEPQNEPLAEPQNEPMAEPQNEPTAEPAEKHDFEYVETARQDLLAERAFTEVNYVLYIAASLLNVRARPSTDAMTIVQLKFGKKVVCEGESDEWLQVRYDGKIGYVKTGFTSKTMVFRSVKENMYVKSSALNMRAEPSTDAKILVKLSKNDFLKRIGIGDEWSKVVTTSGVTGYVATEYLTNQPPVVKDAVSYANDDYSNISQSEIDLFLRIVALEGHPKYGYAGYLSIASVILNRVESRVFPNTITSVVSQPHQFSVYRTSRTPVYNSNVRNAVKDALAGKRNLKSYVLYFITTAEYQRNVDNGGSFGNFKVYKIAYGTVWCYR